MSALALTSFALTAAALYVNMDVRPPVIIAAPAGSVIVSFSPDRRCFATCFGQCRPKPTIAADLDHEFVGEISVWNTVTGREQVRLPFCLATRCRDPFFGYRFAAFSPDGRYLAVLHRDATEAWGTAIVWEVATRHTLLTVPASQLVFSPDNRLLAVVERDVPNRQEHLKLFELSVFRELAHVMTCRVPAERILEGCSRFGRVAFSLDGQMLAYVIDDGQPSWAWNLAQSGTIKDSLVRWNISSRLAELTIPFTHGPFAFSADWRTVALCTSHAKDHGIKVCDLKTGTEQTRLSWPKKCDSEQYDELVFDDTADRLTAISRSHGGICISIIIAETTWHCVTTWDLPTQRTIASYNSEDYFSTLKNSSWLRSDYEPPFAGSAQVLPCVREDKHCWALLNVASGKQLLSRQGEGFNNYSLSPNARLFAVGQTVAPAPNMFWSWLADHVPNVKLKKYNAASSVRSWDVATSKEFPPLPLGETELEEMQFSPDARLLATRCADGTIKLWDLPPRKPLGLIMAWSSVPAALVLLLGWWRGRKRAKQETAAAVGLNG